MWLDNLVTYFLQRFFFFFSLELLAFLLLLNSRFCFIQFKASDPNFTLFCPRLKQRIAILTNCCQICVLPFHRDMKSIASRSVLLTYSFLVISVFHRFFFSLFATTKHGKIKQGDAIRYSTGLFLSGLNESSCLDQFIFILYSSLYGERKSTGVENFCYTVCIINLTTKATSGINVFYCIFQPPVLKATHKLHRSFDADSSCPGV